ncbi:hypothetical protein KSS87_001702 [Heliosperma pusillum]|nr:hypothetical protein KSS87_001702 [Heliosperma pusillum]
MLLFNSTTTTTTVAAFSHLLSLRRSHRRISAMSTAVKFQPHAFAGNPIKSKTPKSTDPISPNSAFLTLKTHLLSNTHDPISSISPNSPNFRVLPFRKGRPLAGSEPDPLKLGPKWHLGWLSLGDCKKLLDGSEVELKDDKLVYLGGKLGFEEGENDEVYWAIDVSEDGKLVEELGKKFLSFVELRTLMARALLEWHGLSHFCGHCGFKTVPMEAGRRVQCSNELCKKRIYPRVDPVVIMLVIDRENDRALLSRQSRFVPRMWSCLAGFIEPGESLEEAVRRETWEETGIEVGEVVYHSSQPWPVGPSSMPCQLMVGFFAFAKSLEINVDKDELEDARWHSREEVKKALSVAEYEKAQKTSATKVDQICKGIKQCQNFSSDYNTESGELAPMFIPGPFAIAHHLISTWVSQGPVSSSENQLKDLSTSLSNL